MIDKDIQFLLSITIFRNYLAIPSNIEQSICPTSNVTPKKEKLTEGKYL
jgi:hypothetical protein